MLDVKTEFSFKRKQIKWSDLNDSWGGDISDSEFIIKEESLNSNEVNHPPLMDINGFWEWYLSKLNQDNTLKNKFNFEDNWINNSKLYNKNIDYNSTNLKFQNSIYNSNEYEIFFYEEIKSLKEYFNKENLQLLTEYHNHFFTKHDETLINLKQYGFNFNYFSPLMRFLSIYFLIHNLSTDKQEYFRFFIKSSGEKVTITNITCKIRIFDIEFIENFIKCLLMEEGEETKILKDLEKLMNYLELETKKLKLDFENNLNLREFLKYISPNVNLSPTDINKINYYISDSISDINFIINSAIKEVNHQASNYDFYRYIGFYDFNKNSIDDADSDINISEQEKEKEKENIKNQLELLNASQIALLIVKLLCDLEDDTYYLGINRAKYCRQILLHFNINEDLILQTEKAIGKVMSKLSLKENSTSTYKIISKLSLKENSTLTYKIMINYFKKNKINIKEFCE